jgi:hypothetical protein
MPWEHVRTAREYQRGRGSQVRFAGEFTRELLEGGWSALAFERSVRVWGHLLYVILSKQERQRQQPRRPCHHHSQQKPLIGFHCSLLGLLAAFIPGETAGTRPIGCGSQLCELYSHAAFGRPADK